MSVKTPEERYLTDPVFHRLTDHFYMLFETMQTTPTEIRDAAMLAMLQVEQRNPNLFGWIKTGSGSLPRDEVK